MKKKRTALWIALGIVLFGVGLGIVGIRSMIGKMNAGLEELNHMTITNVDLSTVPDGTYTGSHEVFPVSAEVKVTVSGHKITGIQLIKHRNGQGKAAESIPGKVIEGQSLQIDVVSGATYSSKVILKAIEKALTTAR